MLSKEKNTGSTASTEITTPSAGYLYDFVFIF